MPQATVNETGQISANVEGIGNLAYAASRMADANWDELRRNRGGNRVEGGGTDHTVIVLPMRPKVLEKDDKHLVLLQDTSCGWICVPCIPCTPQIRWRFDKSEDSISKELRYCCGAWQKSSHGPWKMSQYHFATCNQYKEVAKDVKRGLRTGHNIETHTHMSRIVSIVSEDNSAPPIFMSSQCAGNWTEAGDCACFCHPQDEITLCSIVNDFMGATPKPAEMSRL